MISLPDKEAPYWFNSVAKPAYPALSGDLEVDAVIVGAGITGLTAAYLLKQAGMSVVVLEKDKVGSGTTGRTTGKVTSQHNLIYDDFQKRLGKRTARLYGEANQTAVQQVETIINEAGIDCDWQRDDNYVYTADPNRIGEFRHEAKAAKKLGLPASFETQTPLPFRVEAAVKFANQGKFNSEKYVQGLAKAVDGNGSHVFEHSNVISIRDGTPGRVRTKQGRVIAKGIIVATNVPTLPLMARGAFCLLEYPTESYIVLGKLNRELKGMYISPDDNHYSILPTTVNGERLLLIGGESNISGVRLSKGRKYQKLSNYAARHFGVTEITHKWSDRDYLTYDGPPLVGKLYPWSKHLYVASAFRKWGLTNGTAAAMILRDLITGQPNPWAATFNSNRLKPIANIPRTVTKYALMKS
jgi:glycine/D-amino acid oxidase-like deaminating enzyme